MQMQVPWWAKIGAKLLLSRLPLGYRVWQQLGLFRHGSMDNSDYAIRVFETHAERSGLLGRLRCKTIVELGPGDSIATALIAAAHGAQAILVDAGAYVRADIAPYLELGKALAGRGLDAPDLRNGASIEGILACCNARYLTEGLASLKQLEDESVDWVFSQAVLEHVRRGEFLETMRECRRIVKRGGVCSHQIDLRDHLGGGLNNLRFGERLWESDFFAKSGFYTNRIQFRQMLDLFNEASFQVQFTEVRRWHSLPTPRHKLAGEFRMIPDDELCVSGFEVLLR